MDKKSTFGRLTAGVIFLAGAVYVWGGIGLNPEGVEYIISGGSFSQSMNIYGNCFIIGLSVIVLGIIISVCFGLLRKPQDAPKGALLALGIFALTTFPPQLLSCGLSGIAVSVLLILQNTSGLAGLYLTSTGAGILLSRKLPSLTFKLEGKYLLTLCGIALFALSLLASKIIFGGIPHVGDAVVQLWQAKTYASGSFTVPAPELIEFFFDPFLVVKGGNWFSQYPPGFAIMMVPGVIAGHPELLNPLLAGLTLIIFGLTLKELSISRWWIFLFLLSPFVIFMSGSFMSHPASMFWGALGLWFFLKAKREKPLFLLLWGLAAGLMFIIRPYTALCFNLPLTLFALRKRVGLGILLAGIGFILGSIPYFLDNYFTAGSFFTAGYQAAWDGNSGLFFGQSPWGPPHTPQLGLVHLAALLHGLNLRLFEIPIPALTGVVLWLFCKFNRSWKEWALFWAGICGFVGYYFYFYVDMVYGPRFAYASAFPLLIVSVLGLRAFYRRFRDSGWSKAATQWSFITGGIILFILWGTISLPARLGYYSDSYRDVDNNFNAFIESEEIENAIVFLDDYPSTDRHARIYSLGFTNRQAWYYSWRLSDLAVESALKSLGLKQEDGYGRILPLSHLGKALNRYWGDIRFLPPPTEDMDKLYIPLKQGYIYMSPYIGENDIIFARDLGNRSRLLMEKYPDRNYYRVERTEEGYTMRKLTAP